MLHVGADSFYELFMAIKNDLLYQEGQSQTNSVNRIELVTLPKKGGKRLKNHPVDHDTDGMLWCGLAAVSAITGYPTSEIRDLIKKYRRNPASVVTGTTEYEVEYVLRKLGYAMEYSCYYGGKDYTSRPSLSKWLDDTRKLRVQDVAYLIAFRPCSRDPSWHWGVVLNNQYLCSQTGVWVPLKQSPFRRRKLEFVFSIVKR